MLPRVLAEIADVAGEAAAEAIARAKGGGRMSIPAKVGPSHWLAALVGIEAAQKISRHFTSGRGTVEIEVPLGQAGTLARAYRTMHRMIVDGRSSDEIARVVGMTRRTVLRNKAKLRGGDDRQGSLF